MPFEKIENGKHIGMSADYIRLMQKAISIPIKLIPTKTWSESLKYGKLRKCDIFSLVMPTPERLKLYEFTKPYLNVPLIIATSIEEPFINDIPSIIDKKIGIVKGYAYSELLRKKYPLMKLIDVQNVADGLKMVNNEELFGFIGTISAVGYNIQKNYIGNIKITGKFDDTWNLSIGVRNDEPILKSIFDKATSTISPKQKQEILNKWLSINYQKGIDYTMLWQVSLTFFVIIILILYKNRSINQVNNKLQNANRAIIEQQKMVNKYVLILTTDLNGFITDINEAYCKAIGYTKEELIGKKHTVMRHPNMNHELFEDIWQTISHDKTWVGEISNLKKDHTPIIFNMYIEPIFKEGIKIGYRSISEDITDKKRIEELSITDKLTGLYNRLKLDEIMLMKVEEFKRYDMDFSVILLDIDDFKSVNDTFGHDVGDYILQEIATQLKKHLRITDTIGRWGGEEFVIICENTDLQGAQILAENLRKVIENIEFDKVGTKTISLGLAQFKKDDTIISIFKRTDDALYKAKTNGKNRTEIII
ncbi:diguanylate cyclase, partial [Arcobacteraceae bacterium]|nr:diguanylate cyclase [Arcobacteraceae bacterium]